MVAAEHSGGDTLAAQPHRFRLVRARRSCPNDTQPDGEDCPTSLVSATAGLV